MGRGEARKVQRLCHIVCLWMQHSFLCIDGRCSGAWHASAEDLKPLKNPSLCLGYSCTEAQSPSLTAHSQICASVRACQSPFPCCKYRETCQGGDVAAWEATSRMKGRWAMLAQRHSAWRLQGYPRTPQFQSRRDLCCADCTWEEKAHILVLGTDAGLAVGLQAISGRLVPIEVVAGLHGAAAGALLLADAGLLGRHQPHPPLLVLHRHAGLALAVQPIGAALVGAEVCGRLLLVAAGALLGGQGRPGCPLLRHLAPAANQDKHSVALWSLQLLLVQHMDGRPMEKQPNGRLLMVQGWPCYLP